MLKICEKNCSRKIVVVCLTYIYNLLYNINILYYCTANNKFEKIILPQTDKEKYREVLRNDI